MLKVALERLRCKGTNIYMRMLQAILLLSIVFLASLVSTQSLLLLTLFICIAYSQSKISAFLLGFSFFTVPRFDSNLLILIVFIWILKESKNLVRQKSLSVFLPLISLYLLWIIADWASYIVLTNHMYREPRLSVDAIEYVSFFVDCSKSYIENNLPKFKTLFCLIYLNCFALLQLSSYFYQGLFLGVVICATSILAQKLNPTFLPEQYPWNELGRLSGLLSDPNSSGVMGFLALVIILRFFKKDSLFSFLPLISVLFFSSFSIGLFSGSRTYIIGILLLGLSYLLFYLKRYVLYCICISVVLVTIGIQYKSYAFLPISLSRTLQTIDPSSFYEFINSKIVFLLASLEAWVTSPWFGIGPEKFRINSPNFIMRAGYSLGAWSDNANNFYLGLLIELGLLGVLLFFEPFFRAKSKYPLPIGTLVFGILLTFGSHMEFPEVACLAGVLLNQEFFFYPLKTFYKKILYFVIFPLASIGVGSIAFTAERGFFGWEQQKNGYIRWTENISQGYIECINSLAEFKTLGLHTIVPGKELSKSYLMSGSSEKKVTPYLKFFSSKHPKGLKIDVSMISDSNFKITCVTGELVRYVLFVPSLWSPSRIGLSEDTRLLGLPVWFDNPQQSLAYRDFQ
jgi:hypothetical protein